MSNRKFVRKLRKAGLRYVVLSFDGLKDDVYLKLRGKRLLRKKLTALRNMKNEGMIVGLLPAIFNGINRDQIVPIVKFAALNNDYIKYISFVMGELPFKESRVTFSEILEEISQEVGVNCCLLYTSPSPRE